MQPRKTGQPHKGWKAAARKHHESDWTAIGSRTNCSPKFEQLIDEVASIIRNDARQLLAGNAHATARLIMAQLAHVHKLAPRR